MPAQVRGGVLRAHHAFSASPLHFSDELIREGGVRGLPAGTYDLRLDLEPRDDGDVTIHFQAIEATIEVRAEEAVTFQAVAEEGGFLTLTLTELAPYPALAPRSPPVVVWRPDTGGEQRPTRYLPSIPVPGDEPPPTGTWTFLDALRPGRGTATVSFEGVSREVEADIRPSQRTFLTVSVARG